MKKRVLALLLLLLLTLTACQPTPDEEIVVGKDDGLQTAEAGEEKAYEAPEHWAEDEPVTLSDLTVTIDAEVVVPDVTAYPVIGVSDKAFTQEEADRIIAFLSQGKNLYPAGVTSLKELENLLVAVREEYGRLKAEDSDSVNISKCTVFIAEIERYIEEFDEEAYQNVELKDDIEKGDIELKVDFGNVLRSPLNISNPSDFWSFSSVYFYADCSYTNYDEENNEVLSENDTPVGVTMPREEAIAKAKEILAQLGVTDMTLAQIMPAYGSFFNLYIISDKQAWQLVYVSGR